MISLKPSFCSPSRFSIGHLDVGEGELSGVGCVPAHLLQLGDDLVAGHVALQHQEGDAVVAALLGRLAGADQEVGPDAVGDEGLGAVDDVAPVDLAGGGAQRGDVGAGSRLGDPQRADQLALDPGNQPALLLLLGAELPDRRQSRSPRGRPRPAATPPLPPERESSSTQTASWT